MNEEKENKVKSSKGITLIALIVTIVVLIILAGVAINLSIGQNGLFTRAKQARAEYNAAEAKERLEQEILNIQIQAVKEGKEFNLKYLNEKIDKTKYEITLNDEENPTTAVIKEIDSNFYLTVDSKLKIIKVEEKEPKPQYVKFGEVTWENGKASIALTTKENGTIEYKVGENGVYVAGTTINNLNNGDMVYARINNNGTYTEEQTIKIEDKIQPEEFTMETSNITANSVQLAGNTQDYQTGIRDYTYVAVKENRVVKEITSQTLTEYTIDGLESGTEYVVYMLAYDNAGNVRKSNEETITTPKAPTDVYAKLYTDGTLALSSTNITLSEKTVEKDFGNIKESKNNSKELWRTSDYNEKVLAVDIINKITPINCIYWFYGCKKLETIKNISNLDTSLVTDMTYMFGFCESLTSIDLSHFVTSNVKKMADMFCHCTSLEKLDLRKFDVENVTSMQQMFRDCYKISEIDLGEFNTSNVENMSGMFELCTNLTKLNLSSFDTSNVTDMSYMFSNCQNLTDLNLSSFDTSNVTNMYCMFNNCQNLTDLNLSNFDTSNVTNMSFMFNNCQNLSKILVSSKWKTAEINRDMFNGCGVSEVTVVK